MKEKLEIVAVSFVVFASLFSGIAWVLKPKYKESVLQALKDNEPAFKKWNDELYAPWRKEQVDTAAQVSRILHVVDTIDVGLRDHVRELRDHREKMETVLGRLSHLLDALDHLADAVKQAGALQYDIAQQLHETQIKVAAIGAVIHKGE